MNKKLRELAGKAGIQAIDGSWDYNDRDILCKDGEEWRPASTSEIIAIMLNNEKRMERFAQNLTIEIIGRIYRYFPDSNKAEKLVEEICVAYGFVNDE